VDSDSSAELRSAEIAVVGMSVSPTCGVRDHAGLLAEELRREQMACSIHWLRRGEGSLRAARSEIRSWTRALALELEERRPDLILLHYSVFSYSHRGVPLFVRPTLASLRATGIPMIAVMHEFAYPWRYGGWRGRVWAVTQRLALIPVMGACAGVIVTADSRAAWLASRRWLPRRHVLSAPVFSNLPPPAGGSPAHRGAPLVGLFGYSYQGAAVSLILDALRELRERGVAVRLELLGAPGPTSSAGEVWLAAARTRALSDALSFSGALPAQALSDELAACDVLLFADAAGPSSRKGSLAGSLASGTPVVAIDGPQGWPELVHSDALRVVQPTATALADAIGALLGDQHERESLGARGRSFAAREMGVARTAQAVRALMDEAVTTPRS
jgi:glycosyltransferase involved in cell wall biosynthesis